LLLLLLLLILLLLLCMCTRRHYLDALFFSYKPVAVSNLALPFWKWFTFASFLVLLGTSPHSATSTSLEQALPFCSICQRGGEISRHIYCPSCVPTLNAATCT
jgi:hypothetical protein